MILLVTLTAPALVLPVGALVTASLYNKLSPRIAVDFAAAADVQLKSNSRC